LEIEFTDASTGNPAQWTWDFGDNSLPVTDEQNPTHTFINNTDEPVQYTVSLKACNETGCDITLASKLITVYPQGYDNVPIADFTYTQETFIQPFKIRFFNYSVGDINSFLWNFGDGTDNTSDEEPIHVYNAAGTYTVKLTLNPGSDKQAIYSQKIEVLEASPNFAPVDFKWICIANTDNTYSGEGIVGELIDFEINDQSWDRYCEWDMGDGTKYYYIDNPSHAYLSAGTYTVRLKVTNFDGQLIGEKTKLVTVMPNTQIIQPQENEIPFDNQVNDVELFEDGTMVVAKGNTFISYVYDMESGKWVVVSTFVMNDEIVNIAGSNDFMLVGCPYEEYNGETLKGRVYCFKHTGKGKFELSEQSFINDPEYFWYWRFGQYLDIDKDVAVISAYNEQGKHYKITFWKYDQSTGNWILDDVKFTQSQPTPPKIRIKNNMALINSDLYLKQNSGWSMVNSSIEYNDDYIANGQSTNDLNQYYIISARNKIDNSYAYLYKVNGNNIEQLPYLSLSDNMANFASSVALFENYSISGNTGRYTNCDNNFFKSNASAILYRANNADYFYRYKTFIPENLVKDESFGSKVYINKDHVIIYSPGVDNNQYYKAPSIYYYDNYAYFGDRVLYLPDFVTYNLRKDKIRRFTARIIDVAGGNKKATLTKGNYVEMIGQTITLKSGFSVTKGGSFRGVGTICENYNTTEDKYEKQDSYSGKNQFVLAETIFSRHEQNNFIIAPNPTTNQFSIFSNNPDKIITQILLFDTYGKLLRKIVNIRKQKSVNIKIGGLSSGFYYVRIFSRNTFEIKKVMKL